MACARCSGAVWHHDDLEVELVDLPWFGWPTRLFWPKSRRRCPNPNCDVVTFVETNERIAAERAGITDRAGRRATCQVGHHGRAVSGVAADLGCDWHTVMAAASCCQWFAEQPNWSPPSASTHAEIRRA